MTDRIKGVVVTFDKDIRVDDAENWINAIRMITGVIDVEPVLTDIDDHMNRVRIRHEIRGKLYDVFKET